MIEKWRRLLDGGGQAQALLPILSKAFDCFDHELLIANLYAYCFDKYSLYFEGAETKNENKLLLQCFVEIILGIPQGSTLGPLLFNNYNGDLFLK